MNILFFLTPKEEVAHVEEDDTLRQVVEKLEYHGYSAIPLLEYARCRQIKIDHIFLETYAVNNLMAESIEDYVTEIGVRIIS
jgi:predicted transcriptional regulator